MRKHNRQENHFTITNIAWMLDSISPVSLYDVTLPNNSNKNISYKTECYISCTLHKHMSNHKYLYGNDYHRCVTWFRLVIRWEEANLNIVHHVCVISSEQAGYKLATLGLTRYLTYKTLRISYTIVDIISSNLQY